MARSRNIKPGFFENEDLAELDPHARLLFVGLWLLCDREGRMEYRPKRIGAKIFPYESLQVAELHDQLRKAGFITIYTVDGKDYLQVNEFVKHQNPHPKEKDSEYPLPPEAANSGEPCKDTEKPRLSTASSGVSGTSPAESLNPESPIPHPARPSSALTLRFPRGDGDAPDEAPPTQKPKPRAPPKYSERFERVWRAYPTKTAKPAASEEFERLPETDKCLVERDLIERDRAHRDPEWIRQQREGVTIVYAERYFRRRRFEDEWTEEVPDGQRTEAGNRERHAPRPGGRAGVAAAMQDIGDTNW